MTDFNRQIRDAAIVQLETLVRYAPPGRPGAKARIRRTPVMPPQASEVPCLLVYLTGQRMTADGDANHGEPSFVHEAVLNVSGVLRADKAADLDDKTSAASAEILETLLEAPESDPYAQMHFTNARGAVLMSYRWQKGMDRAVGDMVTRPLVGGPPGCELHLVRRSTLHSLALEWFWAVGRAYELQPLPEAATGEAASADGQLRAGSGRRREALQLGGTPGRPIVKRG